MNQHKIKSIEHLKKISMEGADTFILLKYGLISRKWVFWDSVNRIFYVRNLIDETEQELTEDQLMDTEYTWIGHAMKKGALYWIPEKRGD